MISFQNFDDEVRDKDKIEKEKGKQYGDRKHRAQENDIKVGDMVYMKNIIKENKLTPTFDSTPLEVIAKTKGDVEIRDNETGQELRRNVIHLKKIGNEWKVTTGNNKNSNQKNNSDNGHNRQNDLK